MGKFGLVLLFLSEEAHVFEQHHTAFLQGGHLGLGVGADAAFSLGDGHAQQVAEAGGHLGEAHALVHLALGPAEVGCQDHLGAVVAQVGDGGQGRPDAGVVGDGAGVIERYVEVNPHQHALAAEIIGRKAGQGSLRHGAPGDRELPGEVSPRPAPGFPLAPSHLNSHLPPFGFPPPGRPGRIPERPPD